MDSDVLSRRRRKGDVVKIAIAGIVGISGSPGGSSTDTSMVYFDAKASSQ
jgi:hypothetical protein